MSIQSINGILFSKMIQHGANRLAQNAQYVDSLNVFPVPDGDTGTNMNLSISSGAKEVASHSQEHIGKVGSALAKGLLMGARGNSGVILSQLFRGFSKHIEAKATIDSTDFAAAFAAGVELAYKAVMKPVEGTILTVAKDSAHHAVQVSKTEKNIVTVMQAVLDEANASLQRTPELLPVLKEVGVVDSGGQGLVFIYEGFLAELKGEKFVGSEMVHVNQPATFEEAHNSVQGFMKTEDIVFGYCTEFMVKLEKEKTDKKTFRESKFRNDLNKFGDSLLVISDDEIVKVHIHAEHPGDCLNYAQQYGSLIKMKIENMREQHATILNEEQQSTSAVSVLEKPATSEKKTFGVVSISMGEGISELFKSLGADVIVEGGQTMNPSTEDILKAVNDINADTVFIFPNNKNIIMAAEQAREVSDRKLVVLPTKTIPQGMISLFHFNPEATAEDNEETMKAAIDHVKTGQITFAVRDTKIDDVKIRKDDFMGLIDGKIKITNQNRLAATKSLLDAMLKEAEIVTVLYGEGVEQPELDEISAFVAEQYPDVEIEIHNGKQPLYPYIFAVE